MSKIVKILIAKNAGESLYPVNTAELEVGLGIVGDRYHKKEGTFSKALEKSGDFEVTLIAQEQIDQFNSSSGLAYSPEEFRRNIITSGVSVPSLVGKEFNIGHVTLKGVRLCEPCKYLSGLLGEVIMEKMMGECGIRAVIVRGGNINVGSLLSVC